MWRTRKRKKHTSFPLVVILALSKLLAMSKENGWSCPPRPCDPHPPGRTVGPGSHPAADAHCPWPAVHQGTPRTPFGGPLFYLCHYFFFPVSCSSLPYSQDKTELRQDLFYCHFSFGLVCEPRGGHTRVSSSQLPLASRLRDVKGSKSKGRRRSAPASCSLHAGRLLRLCGRSLASICLEESKVFL